MASNQTCLKNINAGSAFPGHREDFESEFALQHWRTLETCHFSKLMVFMVQFNPELAESTPADLSSLQQASDARPNSVYSVSGIREESAYRSDGRNPSVSGKNSHLGAFSPGDFEGLQKILMP